MKRWLSWIALVLVFAIACGFLANWQFSRRETKLASIELVQSNYSKPPVALSDVLENGMFSLPEVTWRTVKIEGNYLPAKSLLVRNRPNNGQPGFEQLVPFLSVQGQLIFVSRGWLPTGRNQDTPDLVPQVTENHLTLLARVVPSEPTLDRGAPKGQIASINAHLANQITSLDGITNGYLRLVSESPNPQDLPKPMPSPSIEEGNNLSYALQWILFALMSVLALLWRIRRDRDIEKGVVRKSSKKSISKLDEELEDEVTRGK